MSSNDTSLDVKELEMAMAAKISGNSPFSPTSCIFRVPQKLKGNNPGAYQPDVVAIGPFHDQAARASDQFQPIEQVKYWYLHNFLSRVNKTLQEMIISFIKDETRARDFYGEPLDHLTSRQFMEIMILDGCFIIELFHLKKHEHESKLIVENDPIFQKEFMFEFICHDLLLLENQLPWFILKCLYDLIPEHPYSLKMLMLSVFSSLLPLADSCKSYIRYLSKLTSASTSVSDDEPLHILDMMRTSITFGSKDESASSTKKKTKVKKGQNAASENSTGIRLLSPATALSEAGIKFVMQDSSQVSILKIEFEDGVLTIPRLTIGELTGSFFRNLIAFEQLFHGRPPQITSYTVLMCNLIGSSKDMQFLCDKRIVRNWLKAEDGSQFFNNLYYNTFLTKFYYEELCDEVNDYCEVKWNTWRERLKRDHFSNPWKFISLVAAFILLVLTALQTVYTIHQYYSPPGQ